LSRATTPEKKGSWYNSQHNGWSIRRSVPSFSPNPTNEAVGAKSTSCWRSTTRLTRHIYQYAIGTFNTCSREPTYRSLTDTGGGYKLGGVVFPHITSQPSPSTVSAFHLRACPVSNLTNNPPMVPRFKIKNLRLPRDLLTTWSSTETYIYAYPSLTTYL
jgi:hypothetical protein